MTKTPTHPSVRRFHLAGNLRDAIEATQDAQDRVKDLDDDPGLYHRLEAVLAALRGILAEVERA